VDDNATNRRLLAAHLTTWGMRPIVADSGAVALALLASAAEPFALVLIDVHMPDMNGFDLVERIENQAGPEVATVLMLASGAMPKVVARCRALGAESYLIKPIRQSELLNILLRTIDGHASSVRLRPYSLSGI